MLVVVGIERKKAVNNASATSVEVEVSTVRKTYYMLYIPTSAAMQTRFWNTFDLHIYIYVYIYMYIYICICVFVYIYIYTMPQQKRTTKTSTKANKQ